MPRRTHARPSSHPTPPSLRHDGLQKNLVQLAGVVEADWARLKAAFDDRQKKLVDANRAAQFYADAVDADDFIADKIVRGRYAARGGVRIGRKG